MIRGIIAHSGYIPEIQGLKLEMDRLDSLSIFVAHGIDDPMIPVHHGRRSRDLLSATNADLTYREYPSPHKISRQSLNDISQWLEQKCEE